jgi:signal peptidase
LPDHAAHDAIAPVPRQSRRRPLVGFLAWVAQVVSWVLILGLLGLLAVMVAIPRFAGATPYTVLTGSMVPTYPPGTLIVTRPVPIDEIGVGTAITYQLRSGDPTVVTHRVIAVRYGSDGETRFITQGDANNTADREPVRPVQIKGTLWYAVPHLGHINTRLAGEHRPIITGAVVAGLVIYALWLFGAEARNAHRRRRSRTAGSSMPPGVRTDSAF